MYNAYVRLGGKGGLCKVRTNASEVSYMPRVHELAGYERRASQRQIRRGFLLQRLSRDTGARQPGVRTQFCHSPRGPIT